MKAGDIVRVKDQNRRRKFDPLFEDELYQIVEVTKSGVVVKRSSGGEEDDVLPVEAQSSGDEDDVLPVEAIHRKLPRKGPGGATLTSEWRMCSEDGTRRERGSENDREVDIYLF